MEGAITITAPTEVPATPEDVRIFAKLQKARQMFLQMNVKKSGKNTFAKYDYFELADIVPPKTEIFVQLGLCDIVTFSDEAAILTLHDAESPGHFITFASPMRELDVKGANAIQSLGGVETYQRRYLYMMMLDIVESDMFDGTQGSPDTQPPFLTGDATQKAPAQKAPAQQAPAKKSKSSTDTAALINEITTITSKMSEDDKRKVATIIKSNNNNSAAYRAISNASVLESIIAKIKEEFPNV